MYKVRPYEPRKISGNAESLARWLTILHIQISDLSKLAIFCICFAVYIYMGCNHLVRVHTVWPIMLRLHFKIYSYYVANLLIIDITPRVRLRAVQLKCL
jgi:hypothetical protein